jgi:acyl-CoA thioesterase FadM
MYPYLRLVATALSAPFRPKLAVGDEGLLKLRVMPGDIDMYPELNNGRHLAVMDLGRIDLAIRTGLMAVLLKRGWGLTVAGVSVRYRHRIPAFRSFQLLTQLVGHDRLWFYLHQRTERLGKVHSSALIRAGITSGQGIVPIDEVLAGVGNQDWGPELPDWVRAWIRAEELRPWPDPQESTT